MTEEDETFYASPFSGEYPATLMHGPDVGWGRHESETFNEAEASQYFDTAPIQ